MNQFIASIFAAAISFSAVSAISATTTENTDDASSIGTSETPQIVEQNQRVDQDMMQKAPAQNVTEGEYTKKSRLLKTKEQNAGTTKGNKVQPNQPEGAAPVTK